MSKIIYDLGANHGNNLPYYFEKADKVVAVEANPVLARKIEQRFQSEIDTGQLTVVNRVLTKDDCAEEVVFYVHKKFDELSTFKKPNVSSLQVYTPQKLPSIDVKTLIKTYGDPYFVKIDIEGYDHVILEALFDNEIRPPYLSVEYQSPRIFPLLMLKGRYQAFQLVEGYTIGWNPRKKHIHTIKGGKKLYKFNFHEAGPFGDDLEDKWRKAGYMQRLLGISGFGWKDIHVSQEHKPLTEKFVLWKHLLFMLTHLPLAIPISILILLEYLRKDSK